MDDRLLRYQKLAEGDREQFRIALHILLTENFLLRSLEGHSRAYRFAAANFEIIEAYLELAGWGVRKDENLGVISFTGPPAARLQLRKDESIFLLVIRLLYEEKAGEFVIHGERTVRQQEIQDRLRSVADISYRKTPFVALLRRFQALRLIQVVGSEEDPEAIVILYPSIPFVLDGISFNQIAERIASYNTGAAGAGVVGDDGDAEDEDTEEEDEVNL